MRLEAKSLFSFLGEKCRTAEIHHLRETSERDHWLLIQIFLKPSWSALASYCVLSLPDFQWRLGVAYFALIKLYMAFFTSIYINLYDRITRPFLWLTEKAENKRKKDTKAEIFKVHTLHKESFWYLAGLCICGLGVRWQLTKWSGLEWGVQSTSAILRLVP